MPSVNPESQNPNPQTIKNLPRQQKIAVVFLAIFGILIIVFWGLQFSTKLNKPFSIGKNLKPSTNATTTDPSLKDSDGDGLSDYDEVNIYHTSPYLEDSDSDGITDNQEVTQGSDPNCPSGKVCGSTEATPNTSASSSASTTVDILGLDNLSVELLGAGVSGTDISAVMGGVTPTMIRQELLKSSAGLIRKSQADLVVANTFKGKSYKAFIVDSKRIYASASDKETMAKKLVQILNATFR